MSVHVSAHVSISPKPALNKGGGPPIKMKIAASQHSEASDSMLMSKMTTECRL